MHSGYVGIFRQKKDPLKEGLKFYTKKRCF
jgi:hypothetical protein